MRTYQLSALIRVEIAASSSVSARMDHSRCIKTLPSSQSDNTSGWIVPKHRLGNHETKYYSTINSRIFTLGKTHQKPESYHINLLRNTSNSAYIKTLIKTKVVQATCPNPPPTSRHNHLRATTTSPARISNASPLRVEALSLNRRGCCRS